MTKNKTLRSKRAALIVDGRQVFLAENNCVSDKSRRTKPLEQTSLLKACKEPKGRQVREFHFGAGSPVHKGRVLPINHLTCKGKAVVTEALGNRNVDQAIPLLITQEDTPR